MIDIGPAGTPPPQQFRTIDDVVALLRDDFAANGIGAAVEPGEWRPEMHKGEPRVVVGYGPFSFGPPAGADQPGPGIQIPDGSGDVARAILDDLCRFHVWCHHNGGAGGAPAPEKARLATKDLLLNVLRAIREALTAPFREPPAGEWPKPWEMPAGYPDFVYGSFVAVEILIPSPVLGGRLHVRTIAEIDFTDSISIAGTVAPDGGGQGTQ